MGFCFILILSFVVSISRANYEQSGYHAPAIYFHLNFIGNNWWIVLSYNNRNWSIAK